MRRSDVHFFSHAALWLFQQTRKRPQAAAREGKGVVKARLDMLLWLGLRLTVLQGFILSGCGQEAGTYPGGKRTSQIGEVSREQLTEELENSEDTAPEVVLEASPASQTLGPQASISRDAPPVPCSGDFDWIQFRNGEWLKGEIKGLQNDSFSFESEELDTLELDWDDIYEVCSPKWNTYVLEDRTSMLGTLHV